MAKKTAPTTPLDLPQEPESWYLSVKPVPSSMAGRLELNTAPYLALLFNLENEEILKLDLSEREPAVDDLQGMLQQAMLHPIKGSRQKPHRPREVQVEEEALRAKLEAALAALGICVRASPPPKIVDELSLELESLVEASAEDIPALVDIPGVTPAFLGEFFDAAASFYRAKPWNKLSEQQIIAAAFPSLHQTVYAQVMGGGGMEYGLVLYWDWDDILHMYQQQPDPGAQLPERGMHALSFESADHLPPGDLAAIEEYGWKIAASRAYPWPVIFQGEEVTRPPQEELLVYLALLRFMPDFIQRVLENDHADDTAPLQAAYELKMGDERLSFTMQYPGGKLPAVIDLELDGVADADDLPPSAYTPPAAFLDRNLQKANQIVEKAWQEDSPQRAASLAKKALKTSPNCANAYLVLAETAGSEEEAFDHFQKAAQLTENLLGKEIISSYAGMLWRIHEARPYLLALQGMADLYSQDRSAEALALYQEMLHLDPDDHLGVRFPALYLLLAMNQNQPAEELLQKYPEEPYAAWPYSKALLAFRHSGDSPEAHSALQQALQHNRYIPDYLTGRRPFPSHPPDFVDYGDEGEAIHYARESFSAWWGTRGAIDWLKKNTSAGRKENNRQVSRKKKRR